MLDFFSRVGMSPFDAAAVNDPVRLIWDAPVPVQDKGSREKGELARLPPGILNGHDGLINLKRCLLRDMLDCGTQISLPPGLVNRQISEAMEFGNIFLSQQTECQEINMNSVFYIKMRLAGSVGHAAGLAPLQNPGEALLADEASRYK